MKLRELFRLIGTDIERSAEINGWKLSFFKKISILLLPAMMSTAFYRISHFFHVNGHRHLARLFWTWNIHLFASDIAPHSEIGPYFYMPHSVGTVIAAKMGSHVTFYALACIGRGSKPKDVGAGTGLPVVGDHVVIGARSMILGPITIGSHATIGPGSVVMKNVPEHVVVFGNPARVIRKKQPGTAADPDPSDAEEDLSNLGGAL